jgi:hypothetical protein
MLVHYQSHPLSSFICWTDAAGNRPHSCPSCQMPVTLKFFTIISCEIDYQASRIHQQISVSVALLRRPVSVVSCVFCTHSLYERQMCALNGRLITMSRGCNIPVMPPGVITRSHFSCHNWTFTFSVVWPRKLSKTSMDRWFNSAPSHQNHTDLVQLSTRSSVSQPLP